MCGEAALGSTSNGLRWPWRGTAHISLQEPNRHQSLAAVSVRLFPGSFQHIREHSGGSGAGTILTEDTELL